MKRIIFILAGALISFLPTQAQIAVTAPGLELQEAMNHAEQMSQAVQTYQTMMNVQQGIDKGIEAVETVNSKLTSIRDVQDIANRSMTCVKRIEKVYDLISKMKLDLRSTTDLLNACTQTTRECVSVTAYGAKIFTSNFLKMSDADRLAETRKVLDDIDKLLGRVNYINVQANAIKFNNEMLNAYFH